jgi:hypothetical protein
MKINKSSDSGYSLGLVLIFVLAVGTVLGSVLHITQISADAQGRGVDQLRAANSIAVATSEVIREMTKVAIQDSSMSQNSNLPNCGLQEQEADVTVECKVLSGADLSTPQKRIISFTASNGVKTSKVFTIYPGATSSDAERVSESDNS